MGDPEVVSKQSSGQRLLAPHDKDEPTAVDQEDVETTSMDMSIDCRRNRMNRQSRHVHDHPHILSLSRISVLKPMA